MPGVPPAFAQRSSVVRIGILDYGPPPASGLARMFVDALRSRGYAAGENLDIDHRFAGGRPQEFERLLREFQGAGIGLVFAPGHDIAKVARVVLPALPVVTVGSEDPVLSGLIASFRRPGGNVTGVSFMSPELAGKRLEMLRDTLPGLARVGVLWEPEHADTYYQDLGAVARGMGVTLHLAALRAATDLEPAFAEFARERAQALFVVPSRLTNLLAPRIAALAAASRLPAMSAYASFAEAGGLVSYGAAVRDGVERAAAQAAAILRGARPAELPFELPARFELVVNARTARALGISVPQVVLLRADRVIE
ncbi:MAG: ABC transporter substrate-binding protein [Burkholderiales bacterium]|nr:ABC transporter substrate-binding protein [Burkholderiales bacterium]